MRVLFVHQNFPAQYAHLARAIASDQQNEVIALSVNTRVPIPGVRVVRHIPKQGTSKTIHYLAEDFEAKTLRGESAALAAFELKAEGFYPDIICGHLGWGETLFLKDVWPKTKILGFLEFAYSSSGADVGFDPEFPILNDEAALKIRTKNAGLLLAMESTDAFVSPTRWQARQFSSTYYEKINVIHDGIDTDVVKPSPNARITLGRDQITLGPDDEVVTFVNRNLEPYRGYHIFMRSLREIMNRRPRARIVIVGGDKVSYGAPPPPGQSFRNIFLEEVRSGLDMSRIHFVGLLPYATFLKLLQVSSVHVYLTYPFVLSWSLLEAMAAGCAVVASATAPVEEVITDRKNGLLVDFFSSEQISSAVVSVLKCPNEYHHMRRSARRFVVENYDLNRICLPRQMEFVRQVAFGSGLR